MLIRELTPDIFSRRDRTRRLIDLNRDELIGELNFLFGDRVPYRFWRTVESWSQDELLLEANICFSNLSGDGSLVDDLKEQEGYVYLALAARTRQEWLALGINESLRRQNEFWNTHDRDVATS
jgi:hypothetical protein